MLVIVSPAKKLNFDPHHRSLPATQATFMEETKELVHEAQKLSAGDLGRLMKISDKLSELNYQRFQNFSFPFTAENAKQAALAFDGDTYTGLEAETLSDEELTIAQKNFRILSGLYGLLRPLDLIQPYRLEMGTKFATDHGKDLYAFWGTKIAKELNKICAEEGHQYLINCASNEYSKAIDKKTLSPTLITPIFKEVRGGTAKTIGLMAKKARGMMARYIIQNDLKNIDDLKNFDLGGYSYQEEFSTQTDWVFSRILEA